MYVPAPSSCGSSIAACPPAPNVQSTTVSPGRRSSRSLTSRARTGTCGAPLLPGETFGNILDLLQVGFLALPCPVIPDLEAVAEARDDDLLVEPRMLDERRGQHDAPPPGDLRLGRPPAEEPAEPARLTTERVEPRELLLHELLPVGRVVDGDAAVPPLREDDAACEVRAEPGRKRDPVLRVKALAELA